MSDLTLSQSVRDNGQSIIVYPDGLICVYTFEGAKGYKDLWNLEDFKVTEVTGDFVWLTGEVKTVELKTRQDFLSLSYYTLCRIADTLHIGSIAGMVIQVEKGYVKGVLITDKLGNFLTIE